MPAFCPTLLFDDGRFLVFDQRQLLSLGFGQRELRGEVPLDPVLLAQPVPVDIRHALYCLDITDILETVLCLFGPFEGVRVVGRGVGVPLLDLSDLGQEGILDLFTVFDVPVHFVQGLKRILVKIPTQILVQRLCRLHVITKCGRLGDLRMSVWLVWLR